MVEWALEDGKDTARRASWIEDRKGRGEVEVRMREREPKGKQKCVNQLLPFLSFLSAPLHVHRRPEHPVSPHARRSLPSPDDTSRHQTGIPLDSDVS